MNKSDHLILSRLSCFLLLLAGLLSLTACSNPFDPPAPTPTNLVVATPASTITASPPAANSSPAANVAASPTPGQTTLTVVPATITRANGQQQAMTVELARTPQEQETGLMGRTTLPADRGMLFIFPQPGLIGFWMKDTPSALSIAFIDATGNILDIQDMQPYSEEVHKPGQDYLYALEVPKGYFADKNIKPGDKFVFKNN